jgi:hypothetical protein
MEVVVTSTTTTMYGQAIWDPTDGLSRFKVTTHLSPERYKQIEGKGLPPVISPSQGRQQVNLSERLFKSGPTLLLAWLESMIGSDGNSELGQCLLKK